MGGTLPPGHKAVTQRKAARLIFRAAGNIRLEAYLTEAEPPWISTFSPPFSAIRSPFGRVRKQPDGQIVSVAPGSSATSMRLPPSTMTSTWVSPSLLVTEAAMAGADIAADTSSIMIIRFISARRLGAAPVHKPLRNTIVPRRDLHVFYGETAEWSVNAAFMCRKSGTAVRS
nr:hypothetical protein SHINE37_42021 [Rhizobiaceae bacterium]